MYNYGSPRVGNRNFAQLFDRIVPDGFRVVVDGDIVTGIPSYGYKHVGTLILIDDMGAGSIIIDPSFVERRLRMQNRSSVTVHSLLYYRSGLKGIIDSASYMRKYADAVDDPKQELDAIKVCCFRVNDFSIWVQVLIFPCKFITILAGHTSEGIDCRRQAVE